jgi:hypothetical protein
LFDDEYFPDVDALYEERCEYPDHWYYEVTDLCVEDTYDDEDSCDL